MLSYSLKLYLIFYGVNALLMKRTKLTKDIIGNIKKIVIKALKSMAFMTTGIIGYRASICMLSHIFGRFNIYMGIFTCFCSSLGSFFEDGQRNMAYALFMYPKGMEGLFEIVTKKKIINEIPYSLSLMFAAALTTAVYLNDKGILLGNYTWALDKVIS